MAKQDDYTRYTIRVPGDLYERVQNAAEREGRSVNAEIVATLQEKYPAPARWFNFDKYRAHQEHVEARSKEILSEINELTSQYAHSGPDLHKLEKKVDDLFKEHEKLWDFDIKDDLFYDIDPQTSND